MLDPTIKAAVREEARWKRRQLTDRDALSRQINQTLINSDAFRLAKRLLLYVNLPDEVQTTDAIRAALEQEKELFVPYCVGPDLLLFQLYDRDELAPGVFDVLEPKPTLRTIAGRHGRVEQMDLIVMPGVAFDRAGNRLGQGRGYYDRLLAPIITRPIGERPKLIGLAFECQIFDSLPSEPHDVKIDRMITA